ncbi:hypothetical protein Kisp01_10420 [Kineosporia sp. NBRC 101677]|nr:hypothetical protein Kisp01_10420 [Kineosporia sp. NBRC 101677]
MRIRLVGQDPHRKTQVAGGREQPVGDGVGGISGEQDHGHVDHFNTTHCAADRGPGAAGPAEGAKKTPCRVSA